METIETLEEDGITTSTAFIQQISYYLGEFFKGNPSEAQDFVIRHEYFIDYLPLDNSAVLKAIRDPYFLNRLSSEARDELKEYINEAFSTTSSYDMGPTDYNTTSYGDSNSMGESSIGGKTLVKTIPGIPKMYADDNNQTNTNGFSNYLTLAGLAFAIQLVVTLICIFFYK